MQGKGLDISLAAGRLFTVWGIPVTNTLIAAWTVMVVLLVAAFIIGRAPTMLPTRVQNLFEMLFEYVLEFMERTLQSRELALRYFPLIVTIFLFIFTSNLFDFLPFFGSFGVEQGGVLVPFYRPVNTDLNVTLALAIISVFAIELAGIMALGALAYAKKFINFSSPLNFFVGILELVSEISRLVSFSFRLFGNVFAGEVLLSVIALFIPYGAPVPLMAFEMFVGFIQAIVFAMLTLFFIKMAITAPHSPSHSAEGMHVVQ
ncbi:MAG TPA: F0F1 ATP synthase subunit A [Candidatus Paceibacterota bacterium]|nr:F0F1 ATP synthase subunit A [Candidatus Paceibacterota bacterium]